MRLAAEGIAAEIEAPSPLTEPATGGDDEGRHTEQEISEAMDKFLHERVPNLVSPVATDPAAIRRAALEEAAMLCERASGSGPRLASAIRALADTPPDDGWRDMASAPKDGTRVLIACTRWTPADLIVIASWDENVQPPAFTDDDGNIYQDISAWRPLPAPPSQDAGA